MVTALMSRGHEITVLTGITEAMVLPAPPIDEVLPALLEFVGGSVVVGHNVRFDLAFLHAAIMSAAQKLAVAVIKRCADGDTAFGQTLAGFLDGHLHWLLAHRRTPLVSAGRVGHRAPPRGSASISPRHVRPCEVTLTFR